MAIEVCSCGDDSTIQNFGGLEGCVDGIGVARHAVLLSQTKVDGSINGLDIGTDVLDATLFNGKLQDVTIRNRWLWLEGVTDFDSPPVDPNVEDFANGNRQKLSDGIREVTFFIVTAEANKLAAKIKASECRNLSVMYIDDRENLVGDLQGTDFTGRKIQKGSLDVQVIDQTDTTAAKVQIKFNYDRSAKDTAVDYIKDSSISGFKFSTDAVALSDVDIEYVTGTVTDLVFKLFIDFGGVVSRIGAGGLTEVELEIHNNTTPIVETTSAFVESPLGIYTATYTTPVSIGEVIEVRGEGQVYVQKTYDLKALIGKTFTTTA